LRLEIRANVSRRRASSQESHHCAEEDGEFDCRLILFFSARQNRLKMRRIFAGRLSGDAGGNRRRQPGKFISLENSNRMVDK
jgi:hypothetical protein